MLGALIAWLLMEWTPLMPESHVPGVEVTVPYTFLFVIGLLSGLLIGLLLGLAEAAGTLSPSEAGRSILYGALIGAAGGVVGITLGNAVYNACYQLAGGNPFAQHLPSNIPTEARPEGGPGPLSFLLLLFGRSFGWALIGSFIGLSQGIASSSTRKMVNGVIGGFIGGGIGGTAFEILAWMNRGQVAAFPAEMIRFIAFGITGGAIGLFIGFVEELAKKAWLVRLVGRNEGKEYTIFKPVTVLGRSELADVPVFGDPDVAERHATITALSGRHVIEDLGSFSGTRVNDQKIAKEPLRDGAVIVIGKTSFLFRDKASARSGYAPAPAYDAGPAIPTSQHVCPFCGSVKDANGKCECTVGATPTPIASSQPTIQQAPMPTQIPAPPPAAEPTIPQGIPAVQGARLVAISGPYSGQSFPLKGQTVIGREATRDIPLSTDNTVSRDHARIAEEPAGYVLYDMGSTNGTFANGARITQHTLSGGDMVQIGSTKFRFENGAS